MADPTRIAGTCRALEAACFGFAALGALLPVAYGSPVFALYRSAVGTAIGDVALAESSPTLTLVLGITGGSIAGKWIAHWAVVRFGLRERKRWARDATLAGMLSWLALDSASSLACGAWANVVMVNMVPPLLVLPLLARISSECDCDVPVTTGGPARLALASAILGACSGLAIALGMETALFDAWRDGLRDAFFDGHEVPPAARALVRFYAGPIGGATLGQFVLLAYVARFAVGTERWAWRWSLASILCWAAIDSAYGVATGGVFNVLLVNLPCLALTVPPLLWAAARSPR